MTNTELKEGMTIKLDKNTIQCINELMPCDDEYGMNLGNLFKVIENQISLTYDSLDTDSINQDIRVSILEPLWQIGTLLEILQEKANRSIFVAIDNLIYHINENASK